MNKFQLILSICFISFSFWAKAQDDLVAIGQWRSHLAYENMQSIAESQDAVFFGSTQAVLKIYKEDQSLEHLNKVAGLSDMGVQTIEYYQAEKVLVIAYTSGNIDLLYDNGQVTNLSAIKTNSNIIGNKEIHHIYCNDSKIYFSCAFGLVVYDMSLGAFTETVFTQTEVKAATQLNDTLFISTTAGIYAGVLDGRNLQDFSLWIKQTQIESYTVPAFNSKNIINFNNKLYADYNDSLIVYENGAWKHLVGTFGGNPISYWKPTSGSSDFIVNYNFSINFNKTKLIIATQTARYYTVSQSNEIVSNVQSGSWRVKDIVIDQENTFWGADQAHMHRNTAKFRPNAPKSNTISDLHADEEGTLWVTSAQFDPFYVQDFTSKRFSSYKNGIWKNYSKEDYSELDTFFNCRRVISNAKDDKIYIASAKSGLLEMDRTTEVITRYHQYTPESTLEPAIGDWGSTRVYGLALDKKSNLWMSNALTNAPLAVKKRNGDWKSIPISKLGTDDLTQYIEIDRNGFLWIKQINGKVVVFDPGDIDDDTDDRSIELGDNNTVLPNSNIKSLISDRNGVIWVGTDQGLTIFNCSSNVFDGSCQGNRPIITVDEFNGYLLEGENIKDIAVDGANRKWIATDNGVFLLSDDGYDQILYFNESNSPLFNNEVLHIAVDGLTGTVYVATSSGLQSFRYDATEGLSVMDKNEVTVFPHPITADYTGPIAITNLVQDANVKITDISGRLVYETTALGGQAIWNGTDYNGRRAQSGVYLVFIVDEEGVQKAVAKILFIN